METELLEQAAALYSPQAASWAKAAVFRSVARLSLEQGEYTVAAIAAYYSLFHLVLALMYATPQLIDQQLRDKLLGVVETRDRDKSDPNPEITHKAAKDFLSACSEAGGLNRQYHRLFVRAQELRNFLNYGPRVWVEHGKITMGPCTFSPSDVREVVSALDDSIREVLHWAKDRCPAGLTGMAVKHASELLKPKHFGEWHSANVTSNARCFMNCLARSLSE